MTEQKLYSFPTMDILNYLLSATQAWGGFATVMLFVISFVAVHVVKLSSAGYFSYRQKENNEKKTDTPPEPQPVKEPQAAPVYYLVEKKRVRKKPAEEYEEPKRIHFSGKER